MLTIADILEALSGIRPQRSSQVITEACIDSRKVIPGAMFIAIPGEHLDGHDFVEEAFERGAHLALVQKDLSSRLPQLDLRHGLDISALEQLEVPFCLRVDDSVQALQQAARERMAAKEQRRQQWQQQRGSRGFR